METDLIKKRISKALESALNSGKYKNKAELSNKLKTNPTSLNKYLAGDTFPQIDWIYNLCTELRVSPNWIVFGQESGVAVEEPSVEEMGEQLIEAQKKIIKYQEQEIENLKKQLVSKNNNYSYATEPNPELKKK